MFIKLVIKRDTVTSMYCPGQYRHWPTAHIAVYSICPCGTLVSIVNERNHSSVEANHRYTCPCWQVFRGCNDLLLVVTLTTRCGDRHVFTANPVGTSPVSAVTDTSHIVGPTWLWQRYPVSCTGDDQTLLPFEPSKYSFHASCILLPPLPSTVCTLRRVLYTGAQAHCGSYVCVMQHRRPQSVVRTTRPLPPWHWRVS